MAFAICIVNLVKYLRDKKNEFVISKQILKSGTSIGANLSEAYCGISKNDFLSKVYISFKECAETLYWLTLLKETKYISNEQFNNIYPDCNELYKMLSSTTKTVKQKISS